MWGIPTAYRGDILKQGSVNCVFGYYNIAGMLNHTKYNYTKI